MSYTYDLIANSAKRRRDFMWSLITDGDARQMWTRQGITYGRTAAAVMGTPQAMGRAYEYAFSSPNGPSNMDISFDQEDMSLRGTKRTRVDATAKAPLLITNENTTMPGGYKVAGPNAKTGVLGVIRGKGRVKSGSLQGDPLHASLTAAKWVGQMKDTRVSELQRWLYPFTVLEHWDNYEGTIAQDNTGVASAGDSATTPALYQRQKQQVVEVEFAPAAEIYIACKMGEVQSQTTQSTAEGAALDAVDGRINKTGEGTYRPFTDNNQGEYVAKIPFWNRRAFYHNQSNRRVHVKVIEYTCAETHKPMAITGAGNIDNPWAGEIMQQTNAYYQTKSLRGAITNEAAGLTPVTDAEVITDIWTPGKKPAGIEVNRYWKETNHMEAFVLPGRSVTHTTGSTGMSISKPVLDKAIADGETQIKGITKRYIVIATGESVCQNWEPHNLAYIGKSYSDFKMVWKVQYQYASCLSHREPVVRKIVLAEHGIRNKAIRLAEQIAPALTDLGTVAGSAGVGAYNPALF